jgi:hypothetical protein
MASPPQRCCTDPLAEHERTATDAAHAVLSGHVTMEDSCWRSKPPRTGLVSGYERCAAELGVLAGSRVRVELLDNDGHRLEWRIRDRHIPELDSIRPVVNQMRTDRRRSEARTRLMIDMVRLALA